MIAERLPNGNMRVPRRVEVGPALFDTMVEVGPEDPDFVRWEQWFAKQSTTASALLGYSEDQPRDEHGRWTDGGGGGGDLPNTAQLADLRHQWADADRELHKFAGRPDDPRARELTNHQIDICKQMHALQIDQGGPAGIGLPGGQRDVVVVGAGPAGYTAALYGSTEGLDTLMVEASDRPGGQAAFSSRIENYPGFPVGVSGNELAQDGLLQCTRTGTETQFNTKVTDLSYDPETGVKTLTFENGDQVEARTVVIAGGVQFNTVDIPGSEGPGVVYGSSELLKEQVGDGNAIIVGGANSAGQAAIDVAQSDAEHVTVAIRGDNINDGMSSYLVDQLRSDPKIEIREGTTITSISRDSNGNITGVTLANGGSLPASGVMYAIGSSPRTDWVGPVERTDSGQIEVGRHGEMPLETNVPGVFAAGDVRGGSMGRVVTAAGDGAQAIAQAHQYLATLAANPGTARNVRASAFSDPATRYLDACNELDKKETYTGLPSPADEAAVPGHHFSVRARVRMRGNRISVSLDRSVAGDRIVGAAARQNPIDAVDAATQKAATFENELRKAIQKALEHLADVAADGFARTVTNTLTADGRPPTQCMIAVYPRDEDAAAIAPEGKNPEQLHVTLAVMNDEAVDLDRDSLREVAHAVAAKAGPLEGKVGGVGAFDKGERGHPQVLLPDVPGLVELRARVVAALKQAGFEPQGEHGYMPHITVGYSDEPTAPVAEKVGHPLHFDHIAFDHDGKSERIPLAGAATAAGAATPVAAEQTEALQKGIVSASEIAKAGTFDDIGAALARAQDQLAAVTSQISQLKRVSAKLKKKLADIEAQLTSLDPADPVTPTLQQQQQAITDSLQQHIDQLDTATRIREQTTRDASILQKALGLGKDLARTAWLGPSLEDFFPPDETVAPVLRSATDATRAKALEAFKSEGVDGLGLNMELTNAFVGGAIQTLANSIDAISQTQAAEVQAIINKAYRAGMSIPETSTFIRQSLKEAAPWKAAQIARTEMNRLQNGGSVALMDAYTSTTGEAYAKRWLTAPGAEHPRHEDYEGLNGQTVAQSEMFQVGDAELSYPGDPDGPAGEVINCFPAGTLVSCAVPLKGFRSRYEGVFVSVETEAGDQLTGTANHPVLTASGWKPLDAIEEGDYLVCGKLAEEVASVHPHVNQAPVRIEDVFAALECSGFATRIAGSDVDFHGYRPTGQVDVVRTDRQLGDGGDSAFVEPLRQKPFAASDLSKSLLAVAGAPAKLLAPGGPGAAGKVRSNSPSLALLERSIPHPQLQGLGLAPFDSEFFQPTSDYGAANAVVTGKNVLGSAFEVTLSQVINVEFVTMHAEVYNLETENGVYLANGILVHNCRCTLVWVPASEADAPGGNGPVGEAIPSESQAIIDKSMAPPSFESMAAPVVPEFVPPQVFLPEPARSVVERGIEQHTLTPQGFQWPQGTPRYADESAFAKGVLKGNPDTQHLFIPPGGKVGDFTDERVRLHLRTYHDMLEEAPSRVYNPGANFQYKEPQAIFIAGGTASGKSTLRRRLQEQGSIPRQLVRIDPDELKNTLPEMRQFVKAGDPFAAQYTHEESSQMAKEVQTLAISRKEDFVLDGVGGGAPGRYLGKIKAAKEQGYHTKVIIADVPVETAIARAAERARAPGLDYGRHFSRAHFEQLHAEQAARFLEWKDSPYVDEWELHATEGPKSELIAARRAGKTTIFNQARYEEYVSKAEPVLRAEAAQGLKIPPSFTERAPMLHYDVEPGDEAFKYWSAADRAVVTETGTATQVSEVMRDHFPDQRFDFRGFGDEEARQVASSLAPVLDRYQVWARFSMGAHSRFEYKPSTWATASKGKWAGKRGTQMRREIEFSPKYFEKNSALTRAWGADDAVRKQWWPKTYKEDPVAALTLHEFGHATQYEYFPNLPTSWDTEQWDFMPKADWQVVREWKELPGYAATNPQEAFGEVFSMMQLQAPGLLSRAQIKAVNQMRKMFEDKGLWVPPRTARVPSLAQVAEAPRAAEAAAEAAVPTPAPGPTNFANRSVPEIEEQLHKEFPQTEFEFTSGHPSVYTLALEREPLAATPEMAGHLGNVYENLAHQFPDVAQQLGKITMDEKWFTWSERDSVQARTFLKQSWVKSGMEGPTQISMNPWFYGEGSAADLKAATNQALKYGWFGNATAFVGSPQSTLTHEFGHFLESVRFPKTAGFEPANDTAATKVLSDMKIKWREFGGYAGTSPQEAFAEVFEWAVDGNPGVLTSEQITAANLMRKAIKDIPDWKVPDGFAINKMSDGYRVRWDAAPLAARGVENAEAGAFTYKTEKEAWRAMLKMATYKPLTKEALDYQIVARAFSGRIGGVMDYMVKGKEQPFIPVSALKEGLARDGMVLSTEAGRVDEAVAGLEKQGLIEVKKNKGESTFRITSKKDAVTAMEHYEYTNPEAYSGQAGVPTSRFVANLDIPSFQSAVPSTEMFTTAATKALEDTGGFSLDVSGGTPTAKRWVTALGTENEEVVLPQVGVPPSVLSDYQARKAAVVSENPGSFLGGWVDPDTGKVYLDVSTSFADQEAALRYAGAHGQYEIWDNVKNTAVKVPDAYFVNTRTAATTGFDPAKITREGGELQKPPGWEDWSTNGISDAERTALKDYSGPASNEYSYIDINEYLRGRPARPEYAARLDKRIDLINQAIDRAPRFAEPVTVYRGVDMEGFYIEKGEFGWDPTRESQADWAKRVFTPNEEITMGGFQSTSFKPERALNPPQIPDPDAPPGVGVTAAELRGRPALMFEIKTDHGAVLGGNGLAKYPETDAELLLGSNTRYKVVNVLPKVKFRLGDTMEERTVVQVEAI